MSDASGGLGSGTSTAHTDAASANQAREGFAALQGPRSGRDATRPKSRSIAPPTPPNTRWNPPAQPCGNPKGERL